MPGSATIEWCQAPVGQSLQDAGAGQATSTKIVSSSGGALDPAVTNNPKTSVDGVGLGLLPEAVVDMHFTQRQRLPRLVTVVRRRPSLLGIGIDEGTAILVRRRGLR